MIEIYSNTIIVLVGCVVTFAFAIGVCVWAWRDLNKSWNRLNKYFTKENKEQ